MKKNAEYSIKRRMLYILVGSLIPVIIVLIFYNFYVVNILINQKMAESNSNTLSFYCSQLEKTLDTIDIQMIDIIANDGEFKKLAYTKEGGIDAHLSSYNISEKYKSIINSEKSIAALLIISVPNNIYRASYRLDVTGIELKEEMMNYFREYVKKEDRDKGNIWRTVNIENRPFLYRIMGYRDTYSVCLLDLDSTELSGNEKYLDSDAKIVFFTNEEVLTEKTLIQNNDIGFTGRADYYFSGKPQNYLVIEQEIDSADVKLAYMVPNLGLFRNLNNSQYILLICSCLTLLMIPIGYLLLRRMFFNPIDMLVDTMENIKSGEEASELDESYQALEFRQVNETFNSMLRQIKQLKIDSYEKEIDMQKVLLQYYQIQIKPHFYLNCLKSIYGMAEVEKYDKIQKMILYLSKHLRYMMQENSMVVTFEEELQYIRNYVLLQEISMKYPPSCEIEGDVSLLDMRIPAISILSFVENSVKYSATLENKLEIKIKTAMLHSEEGGIANIIISDNGIGFTEDQLKKLNFYEDAPWEDHIGIRNVIQRFQLYFGKSNVGFAFSNVGGAVIDVFIKLSPMGEGKGETHEAINSR